jgi:hypothetical protein
MTRLYSKRKPPPVAVVHQRPPASSLVGDGLCPALLLEQTTTGGERKGKVTSGKAVASAGLVPFVLLPIQPLRGANLSRSEASSETTGSAGGRLFLSLSSRLLTSVHQRTRVYRAATVGHHATNVASFQQFPALITRGNHCSHTPSSASILVSGRAAWKHHESLRPCLMRRSFPLTKRTMAN